MAGYATPAWKNNSTPAIDAASLTAIGQGIELGEHPYGVCSTAASTAAKTVTIDFSGTLTLFTGLSVRVKFSNANTAASPTLNVNGTGAKPILFGTGYRGSWIAGAVAVLTYDGTNWVMSIPFGIDETPTDGSANLVSSSGINSALSDLKSTTCNPNLLDNWFFAGGGSRFPINSRGQTVYTGAGFSIDRWYIRNTNGGGTPSVQVQNDGILVTFNGLTNNNLQGFHQQVSDFLGLAGKTVTLSMLIATNTLTGSAWIGAWNSSGYGTNNGTIDTLRIEGKTGLVTKTMTMPDAFTNPFLNVGVYGSDTSDGAVKPIAIKLEIGESQTLAHQVNGVWVLNEIPEYTVEEINSYTSTAYSDDTYANKSVEYTDRFVVVDSEYTALNPWPASTYYYRILTAPTGYRFVSAVITHFAASDGVLPIVTLDTNADYVCLIKPKNVTFASNAKAQVRALAIKI